MRNFIDSLKARRDAAKNEGGFSLIDVVVTVAIIVALSVGGFVAYGGIVENAKKAAVSAAADQVYTALTVKNSGSADDEMADPIKAYNTSANGTIKVFTDGTKVVAVHKDATGAATIDNFEKADSADDPDTNNDLIVARGGAAPLGSL